MNWRLNDYEDWLRYERGLREESIRSYLQPPVLLSKFLGRDPLSPDAVRGWFRQMIAGGRIKASSIALRRQTLSIYLNWYETHCGDGDNIIRCIHALRKIRPPRYKPNRRCFTEDEVARLLRQPDLSTSIGLRDRTAMEFLYMGLRIGEVLALRVEDVDLRAGIVRVLGKGNKERHIYIPWESLRIISRFMSARDRKSNRLFHIQPDGFRKSFSGHTRAAGLGHQTPHTFRHSLATILTERGVDPTAIQYILGHEDFQTTRRYIHSGPSLGREAMLTRHPRSSPGRGRAAPIPISVQPSLELLGNNS